MLTPVLKQFGLNPADCTVHPHGSGLINSTWVIDISGSTDRFILQRINRSIFHAPLDIAYNIRLIADHLEKLHPDYLFVSPVKTIQGSEMVILDDEFYRLFPFINGSRTINVVETPGQAYEAARQFGRFTSLLTSLDANSLRITLPDFHDLSLRYSQFEKAVQTGNPERISHANAYIRFLQEQRNIAGEFEFNKGDLKTRVIHHDTKISNVLFDGNDKGLCVIDLDTVMPGYFISDVGDMMRTYLSPVNEEAKDFSGITIRPEMYEAIKHGYLAEMGGSLLDIEKEYFLYSGKYMIYMQALRFLTDYLNNDIYYGSRYEGHNWVRAGNQVTLLQKLLEFESSGGY